LLSPAAVSGPVREAAHPGALRAVLQEFSRHDWPWYRRLAVAVAEHAPLDVSTVRCPVTFIAGRYDSLVDIADMRAAAEAVPGARPRASPVPFLAGRYASLVDIADMRAAAEAVPGARLRELAGTHFIPLQYPEVMLEELRRLAVP